MVPYILSEFSSVFGTLSRFAFAEAPYAPLKFIFKSLGKSKDWRQKYL